MLTCRRNVALIAGFKADRKGNLYTGASTEDTPALVEAAAFHDGIVIAQVNELVDDECDLPRVDIPGSWIDYVVVADKPFFIEPLFTRDPRLIKQEHILMAMMAIKGIYAEHQSSRSTTVSALTLRQSSCCCRPTVNSWV